MKYNILVAFIIAIVIAVPSAMAYQYETTIDGVAWSYNVLDDDTVEITCLRDYSYAGELIIPQKIDGRRVSKIGSNAFSGCSSLYSVVIPFGVTKIECFAFYRCPSLRQVTIPYSVKSIGEAVDPWDSRVYIGPIFSEYGHETVDNKITINVAKGDSSRVRGLVERCNVGEGDRIDMKCVEFEESVSSEINGASYYVREDGFIVVGRVDGNPCVPTTRTGSIDIPEGGYFGGVIAIADRAFYGCNSITSIKMPYSVRTIGASAFAGCSALEEIEISEYAELIGDNAFAGCSRLRTVHVARGGADRIRELMRDKGVDVDALTFIEPDPVADGTYNVTVYGVPLQIHVTGREFYIDNYKFTESMEDYDLIIPGTILGCKLRFLELCSFSGWKMRSLTITDDACRNLEEGGAQTYLRGLATEVFEYCDRLESVVIGEGLKKLPGRTFKGCTKLKSVQLPSTIERIGGGAFGGCKSLESIVLPEKLTELSGGDSNSMAGWNEGVFNGCSSLREVTIPSSLANIGNGTFSGCSSLHTLNGSLEGVKSIGTGAFSGCNALGSGLICKDGCLLVANLGYPTEIEISSDIRVVADGAFSSCEGITSFVSKVPMNISRISALLPKSYWTVERIEFSSIGGSVPDECFKDCARLKFFSVPVGVKTIGRSAFQACESLEAIEIPESVTQIKSNAFAGCTSLKDVYLPQKFNGDILGLSAGCLIHSSPANEESWRYGAEAMTTVEIKTKVRDNDPTVIDVQYQVRVGFEKVKVRSLAFKDGTRNFANVIRPETFTADADGCQTSVNVGDGIAANEWHNLAWKVDADWDIDLAKVKVEILAKNEGVGLWAFKTEKIPATEGHPAMIVSKSAIPTDKTMNALYWLYASKDTNLSLVNGQLRINGATVVNGASLTNASVANRHIAEKMGYKILEGSDLSYVSGLTRKSYSGYYFYKTIEE